MGGHVQVMTLTRYRIGGTWISIIYTKLGKYTYLGLNKQVILMSINPHNATCYSVHTTFL